MDSGQTKCNCCSNITDERSLRSLFFIITNRKSVSFNLIILYIQNEYAGFFVYFYNISQTGRGIYQFDYAEAANRK